MAWRPVDLVSFSSTKLRRDFHWACTCECTAGIPELLSSEKMGVKLPERCPIVNWAWMGAKSLKLANFGSSTVIWHIQGVAQQILDVQYIYQRVLLSTFVEEQFQAVIDDCGITGEDASVSSLKSSSSYEVWSAAVNSYWSNRGGTEPQCQEGTLG